MMWSCFLLSLVGWVQPTSIFVNNHPGPYNIIGMLTVCDDEYPNSLPIVCSSQLNVSDLLLLLESVTTCDGITCNLPVATLARGPLVNQLLGATGLNTSFRFLNGTVPPVSARIAMGCDANGTWAGANQSCNDWTDTSRNYSSGTGGAIDSNWITGTTSRCTQPYYVYCIISESQPSPTNVPSRAPSSLTAPTRFTFPPTPTSFVCPFCNVTIFWTGNQTQVVDVGPVVVWVPPSIFGNNSNRSVNVLVIPVVLHSPGQVVGSSNIVSINLQDTEGSVNLSEPIQFVLPHSTEVLNCKSPVLQCVWWNNGTWSTSGCRTTQQATSTECSCDHLTDFAVLLDQSKPCSQSLTDEYPPFIAAYSALFLYCTIVVTFLLCATRGKKEKNLSLVFQHAVIGVVAALRAVSSLRFMGVFGDGNALLAAFVTAAPYPLEYLLFTRLASTWAGLIHFGMLNHEKRWLKVRPWFIAINILGACLTIALFVSFMLDVSYDFALGGTVCLAVLYFALGIVFWIYARLLLKELQEGQAVRPNAKCGAIGLIRWSAVLATLSFFLQATSSILSIIITDWLLIWTAVFLFSNVVALTCLAIAYSPGFLRTVRQTKGTSAVSSKQPIDLKRSKTNESVSREPEWAPQED